MQTTTRSLKQAQLYGILDLSYVNEARVEFVTEQMILGGVNLVQLRAKNLDKNKIATLGQRIIKLTQPAKVPLIINDFPELVQQIGAEGCHVGQDDLSVEEARIKAESPSAIIGKSTHSLEQAIAATKEGADYIGFGPLFATPTKPDYKPIGLDLIARAHAQVHIPIFCIGGIKLENLPTVIAAGAKRVVIVSGILQAPDIIGYCEKCVDALAAT